MTATTATVRVTVDRDSSYAPCSYLLCAVDADGNWDTRDDSRTVLIDSDWDYPSIAQYFGFQLCCGFTDGTVDCPEHGTSATDMISDAADWLDDHRGEIIDLDAWTWAAYRGEEL
jgi:hypothetical protein